MQSRACKKGDTDRSALRAGKKKFFIAEKTWEYIRYVTMKKTIQKYLTRNDFQPDMSTF